MGDGQMDSNQHYCPLAISKNQSTALEKDHRKTLLTAYKQL